GHDDGEADRDARPAARGPRRAGAGARRPRRRPGGGAAQPRRARRRRPGGLPAVGRGRGAGPERLYLRRVRQLRQRPGQRAGRQLRRRHLRLRDLPTGHGHDHQWPVHPGGEGDLQRAAV
ncbi:MAG: hypothetical protein AVDCRST_MAG49-2721, partial [uncultured Thermomicrobiales bacterium]